MRSLYWEKTDPCATKDRITGITAIRKRLKYWTNGKQEYWSSNKNMTILGWDERGRLVSIISELLSMHPKQSSFTAFERNLLADFERWPRKNGPSTLRRICCPELCISWPFHDEFYCWECYRSSLRLWYLHPSELTITLRGLFLVWLWSI